LGVDTNSSVHSHIYQQSSTVDPGDIGIVLTVKFIFSWIFNTLSLLYYICTDQQLLSHFTMEMWYLCRRWTRHMIMSRKWTVWMFLRKELRLGMPPAKG